MAPKVKYFHTDLGHKDSSENIFLRRELEHVRTGAYEVEFPDEIGRDLLPIDHSVPNGAEMVTFQMLEGVGKSKIGGGYSTEGPRVDVKISDESNRVIGLLNSYGYSIQEVRNALMAGRPLSQLRARTARTVIEQDLNQLMLVGSVPENMPGLFNLSDTVTHTVANGLGGTIDWQPSGTNAGKTPDEIIEDMNAIADGIVNFTKEIEKPRTLVLPTSSYQYVHRTRMGDGSDKSILQHFLANSLYIKEVKFTFELETAGAGSTKRMMAYTKDATKLQGVIPQEFEQFAPQVRGLETVVNCHARWGGIEVAKPKSISYGDGI